MTFEGVKWWRQVYGSRFGEQQRRKHDVKSVFTLGTWRRDWLEERSERLGWWYCHVTFPDFFSDDETAVQLPDSDTNMSDSCALHIKGFCFAHLLFIIIFLSFCLSLSFYPLISSAVFLNSDSYQRLWFDEFVRPSILLFTDTNVVNIC